MADGDAEPTCCTSWVAVTVSESSLGVLGYQYPAMHKARWLDLSEHLVTVAFSLACFVVAVCCSVTIQTCKNTAA